MVAASFDVVEVDGVRAVVAGPLDPFTAPVSFVADTAVFAEGLSDDIGPESCRELDGDDPPGDESPPESAGAADATADILATAIPMPSATASAPMPPMCFALFMVVPFAHPRHVNGAVVINTGCSATARVVVPGTPTIEGRKPPLWSMHSCRRALR